MSKLSETAQLEKWGGQEWSPGRDSKARVPKSCAEFPARQIVSPAGSPFSRQPQTPTFHSHPGNQWLLSQLSEWLSFPWVHPWLSWEPGRRTLPVLPTATPFIFQPPLFESRSPWASPFIKKPLPCPFAHPPWEATSTGDSPIRPNDGETDYPLPCFPDCWSQ